MNRQIQVPEELEVTFTALELSQILKHLETGQFLFVNPIISVINRKLEESFMKSQATTEEPKPIGGGGGGAGAPRPKPTPKP